MENRKLKKQREAAAKLSRPRPVELPSGRWRCQVMVGGKRIDVIEDDPGVAHAKALAVKAGLLEQRKPAASMTIGQAIDRYIDSKDAVLSPSTVAGYKRIRKNALHGIMDMDVQNLTQEAVQREINHMAKHRSPKSVRNAHGLLSAVLAVYKPDMVLRTTLPQREIHEVAIPNEEQIASIMRGCVGTPCELPILLAMWLGLRASEIRGLTWDCIEGERIHICKAIVEAEDGPALKKTKTVSGDRWIQAPEYILDLISRQPKTDDFIVHMDARAMYGYFVRLCKNLGLPHFRFHDLRHASASVYIFLNIPNKYAQKRMGHATDNMLKNVYQHTMQSKEDEYAQRINEYFQSNYTRNFTCNK